MASIVLVICATSFDANAYEMPYDISSIIIPATVEVNFAIVSGKHSNLSNMFIANSSPISSPCRNPSTMTKIYYEQHTSR